MLRWLLIGPALMAALEAWAETLTICYNYGCSTTAEVVFNRDQMSLVGALFARTASAEDERRAISKAVGLFERFAGEQTPTHNDKGGNYSDDEADGRMDCIDESTNASQYLMLLEARGWLKYHRVSDPVERSPLLFNEHWGASVLEVDSGRYYAVDSWFYDNGEPAVVLELDDWKSGGGPGGR